MQQQGSEVLKVYIYILHLFHCRNTEFVPVRLIEQTVNIYSTLKKYASSIVNLTPQAGGCLTILALISFYLVVGCTK